MTAAALTAFTIQFNRYAPIPVFIFGLTGGICNLCTFTRPALRKNPCSLYLIASAISDLFVLFFGLVVRSLSDGFQLNPMSYDLLFCKFRYFILHSALCLSSWYKILAGLDCFCISSTKASRRRFSRRKVAVILIVLTTFLIMMFYIHIFALFTIEQTKSGPSCYAQSGTYRIFYDFLYFATYSFLPPLLMILLELGTIRNIHQIHLNVTPIGSSRLRKRDRQFIRMLLIQLIVTTFLTLPIAIQKLYATFTENDAKDSLRLAIENFFPHVLRQFSFIQCSISFYLFFFTSKGFRSEFTRISASIFAHNSTTNL